MYNNFTTFICILKVISKGKKCCHKCLAIYYLYGSDYYQIRRRRRNLTYMRERLMREKKYVKEVSFFYIAITFNKENLYTQKLSICHSIQKYSCIYLRVSMSDGEPFSFKRTLELFMPIYTFIINMYFYFFFEKKRGFSVSLH